MLPCKGRGEGVDISRGLRHFQKQYEGCYLQTGGEKGEAKASFYCYQMMVGGWEQDQCKYSGQGVGDIKL